MYFLEILSIPKFQRVSVTLKGCDKMPQVDIRNVRGVRGFLKAEGPEGQKYLGQGSPTAQADNASHSTQNQIALSILLKALNICSVELRSCLPCALV